MPLGMARDLARLDVAEKEIALADELEALELASGRR